MHNPTNLFTDLPRNLPDELFTTLLDSANVRIERIVSQGHASPDGFWYDQEQHEWVVVLKGAARLRFADGVVELNPGDWIDIPAHTRHRVEWTTPEEPTIWLAVHYGLPASPPSAAVPRPRVGARLNEEGLEALDSADQELAEIARPRTGEPGR
jgi:cupin 2 domain-containing protein